MSTVTQPRDRLQPALLDRLTDLAPEASVEGSEQRVMSKQKLREAVLRDLGWLFNAVQPALQPPPEHASAEADDAPAFEEDPFSPAQRHAWWAAYPQARQSVLAYGLPPISGKLASKIDIQQVERSLRDAILRFEPRLLERGLSVRALEAGSVLDTHNVIEFEIRGYLWAQPVPLELLLRTQLDLEAGQVRVLDAGSISSAGAP
ncbi:MAG: type VI secretion system baseplate subunit TssE [Leptothrix sp. (in: b-proteobacteria)]